jgi:hypothetical protein
LVFKIVVVVIEVIDLGPGGQKGKGLGGVGESKRLGIWDWLWFFLGWIEALFEVVVFVRGLVEEICGERFGGSERRTLHE